MKVSDSPLQVYGYITERMRATISALDINADDKDLEDARIKAVEFLNQQYKELKLESDRLQRNADWDTLTVAFYGETNAGKSTIIETLRLALREPTKERERAEFAAMAKTLDVDELRLESTENAVQVLESKIVERQELLEDKEKQVADEKRSRTFLRKLLGMFRKTLAEIALQETSKQLAVLRVTRLEEGKALAKMQASAKKLENYADGRIIGDGSPDYTRATHSYLMENASGRFAILDVPGIEGKESAVQDEILSAVQKAHVVFYVTGKAAPPQVGDQGGQSGGHIGTLEKIKRHLGAQSEVWSIFNKRVNNPVPLGKAQSFNSGELEGISSLDKAMTEHLGEHYRSTIPMIAHPAFLALADCLAPGSARQRNRKKFVESFPPDQLLKKSNFSQLVEELDKLSVDAKPKILRSNLNKANVMLRNVIEQIGMHHKALEKHGVRVEREIDGAETQLDSALKTLKSRMATLNDDVLTEFRNTVRAEIYAVIDGDIDKNAFKAALENTVKSRIAALEKVFPEKTKEKLQGFQREVEDVLSTLKKHLDDLQSLFEKSQSTGVGSNLNIPVDIHHGINWWGLVGSGAGIGASIVGFILSTGGAGAIVAAVAGVIAGLIGAWKSVRGWLSSEYRKNQQREAADKAIRRISSDLENALTESMEKPYSILEEKLESISSELESLQKKCREIPKALKEALKDLKKVAVSIDKDMAAASAASAAH